MTRRDIDSPEQLLSAYADGALDADEEREVEAYLDANPSERAELERFRDTLREVKALSPSVRDEPSWNAMSASISRELDAVEAEQAGTWTSRFWRWFRRPGVVAGFGVAAVAAAAIAIFVMRDGGGPEQPVQQDQIADVDIDPDSMHGVIPDIDDAATEVAELDDMDEDELDALLASISLDGGDDDVDDVFGDLLADDDLLSSDALAEWTGDDEDPSYTSGLGVDMFDEPEYDWLDELDEDEIDALDRYLDSIQAG